MLAAASVGDVTLLAAAFAVGRAGRESRAGPAVTAGVGALLAAAAVVVRWRTPSLELLAGAQAVLGPAGWVGPAPAAAAAWCAAAAFVLGAGPVGGRGGELAPVPVGTARAVAAGLAATAVVAGPGPTEGVWLRVAAAVGAVGLAWVAGRLLPPWPAAAAALGAGAAALALAGVA